MQYTTDSRMQTKGPGMICETITAGEAAAIIGISGSMT